MGLVRLRLENQLGYKMVKWIRSMELIARYDHIGAGYGGWRAALLHYRLRRSHLVLAEC